LKIHVQHFIIFKELIIEYDDRSVQRLPRAVHCLHVLKGKGAEVDHIFNISPFRLTIWMILHLYLKNLAIFKNCISDNPKNKFISAWWFQKTCWQVSESFEIGFKGHNEKVLQRENKKCCSYIIITHSWSFWSCWSR
jgi:hypothetical protein